jgi:O-antigen ligase
VNSASAAESRAYPRPVKDRLPLLAVLGLVGVLVQDALARQGSAQAGVTVLVACLAMAMLLIRPPARPGPPPVKLPVATVLFVVFAAARLATVPSVQGLQNWLVWFLFPAAAVVIARRTTPGTAVRLYRWWLPATLFAGSVYGLLVLRHEPGYAGTLYSARGMGWVLLIAMAFVVGGQVWKRAFMYWPVWFSVFVIGITLTRSASVLALLSATGLAVLNRRGRLTLLRFATMAAAMGLVGYLAVTRVGAIRDRFTVGDAVKFNGTVLNTSGRTRLWSATWHAIPEHPIIGHGPGQAQYFIKSRFVTIEHPHNEYLRLLYDTGWIGLALWLVGMLLLLLGCWRRLRVTTDPIRRGTHLAAVLAIIDLLLGSITDNLTVGLAFMLICSTLVGLSMGMPEDASTPDQEPDEQADSLTRSTATGRWIPAR